MNPVPNIGKHLGRPSTTSAARRNMNRLSTNANAPVGASDVINPLLTGAQLGAGAQSAGLGTTYTIVWSAPDFDTSGVWSAGSPTHLTITKSGYWSIQTNVQINPSILTNTYTLAILKNGGAMGAGSTASVVSPGTSISLSASTVALLVAGDVITVQIGNASGFTLESVTNASVHLALAGS